MKGFCCSCNKTVDGRIVSKKEKYNVMGDGDIVVDAKILYCPKCNEQISCEELDDATLNKAYDKYRKKHKLLRPKDIVNIRKKYGLSQRGLARLLNWGDKTIWRYELGSLQDRAHNSLLMYIKDPINMKEYIKYNETSLSNTEISALKKRTDEIIKHVIEQGSKSEEEKISYTIMPIDLDDITFSYKKFTNAVLMLSKLNSDLLKVKLLKLLYYADNLHYKNYDTPITGSQYLHYQFGPVPMNYEHLLNRMILDKKIKIVIKYKGEYELNIIRPIAKIDTDVFKKREIETIKKVSDAFSNYNSSQMAKITHDEEGYKKTKQGQIIPYHYSKQLIHI